MSSIKFTATKLTNSGKKGVLTPDADGYYELVIGGLNVYNSMGQYYVAEGAADLFKESSIFMRRVSNGCLKSELGHPKRLPGMSMDDYINRLLAIEETNIVAHIKEVWLDADYGKQNPQMKNPALVAIKAKVKGSGPKADAFSRSVSNPSENICFSIRAMTRDYYEKGQTFRVLQQIVTFDMVTEPGISIANKWDSSALECISSTNIKKNNIDKIEKQIKENTIVMEDTRVLVKEASDVFRAQEKLTTVPYLSSKW